MCLVYDYVWFCAGLEFCVFVRVVMVAGSFGEGAGGRIGRG